MTNYIMNQKYSLFLLILIFFSCSKKDTEPKSSIKNITKFSFNSFNPIIEGTIDSVQHTITVFLPISADASKLVPTIKISNKANIFPLSETVQDFTKPVTYTVTAEDGTIQIYSVNVIIESNFLKYNSESYEAKFGKIAYDLRFYNEINLTDDNPNTNMVVHLEFKSTELALKEGKYELIDFSNLFKLASNTMTGIIYNKKANGEWGFVSGSVDVSKINDSYKLTFEGILSNGAKVKGYYLGQLNDKF